MHVILTELCLDLETISKMRLPSRSLESFSQLFHQIYAYVFLYMFSNLLMKEMSSVLQAGHSCPSLQYDQLFCRNGKTQKALVWCALRGNPVVI